MKCHGIYKYILLVLVFAFLLTGCGTQKQLTKQTSNLPYSDWEKCDTGSTKYLDGDTVLVSIFLEDNDAIWTSQKMNKVYHNLQVANDFLVAEGERYGKEVNLIYDYKKYPELEYHFRYSKEFQGYNWQGGEAEHDVAVEDFLNKLYEFVEKDIPSKDIMTMHNVDSIGFLVYVDHEASSAVTYTYSVDGLKHHYPEICFLNMTWESDGRPVMGSTYAHEILHLFGAKDLYSTDEDYNITRDAVVYAYENNEKDIMLGGYRKGVDWKNKVSGEISDITAYYLGWKYSADILKHFPDMVSSKPACFVKNKTENGDYTNPNIAGRLYSQEDFLTVIIQYFMSFVWLLIIIVTIILNYRRQKNNQQLAQEVKNQTYIVDDGYIPFMAGNYNDIEENLDEDE